MNWLSRLELRSRARVPIINLQHKNGIECDISVGVSAQDTSHIVEELKMFCGPALLALSSFLKVFLYQFDLDKPFTGGLGSYKLYVIIAAHIEKNQTFISDKLRPDLGSLLLTFLKYYGNPRNLNGSTTIRVLSAEVCMDRTNRVGELQKLFEVAHSELSRIVQKRLIQAKTAAVVGSSSGGSGSNQALIIKSGGEASKSSQDHQKSSSALAALLQVEDLSKMRERYRNLCHRYPLIPETDLVSMAQNIVNDLERRLAFPKGLSVDEIERINPCLYARLRSFPSVEAAVRHLGSRDATFAPSHFAGGGGGGGVNGGAFPRTKSLPALPFNGGGGSAKKGFGRDSIPASEYKFSFNGVVGNSITDLPSATNKRVSHNKKKLSRNAGGDNAWSANSSSNARHSFGGVASSPSAVLGKRPPPPASSHHQQQNADNGGGKRFKPDGRVDPEPAPVIPNRYANTKSGHSFANGNYKTRPVSATAGASAATSVPSAANTAEKIKIAVAANKLSHKINDSITELKAKLEKTKNSLANSKKKSEM